MDEESRNDAVEALQRLGLKEYEARSFVALSRLPNGTAKDIAEVSEVPRTRVYDAIRVLETKGLVETQHSNPQRFRAVAIDEAVDILRSEYLALTENLRGSLEDLDRAPAEAATDVTHEVWALSGDASITRRTQQLIDDADEEIAIVIGHRGVLTEALVEHLQEARERGVRVLVGTVSEDLQDRVREALPEAEVFVSELEWLRHSQLPGDDTEISRLVLVDRGTILVSSFVEAAGAERADEQAVFGSGFDNGLVAIVRRLFVTGLLVDAGRSATDGGEADGGTS